MSAWDKQVALTLAAVLVTANFIAFAHPNREFSPAGSVMLGVTCLVSVVWLGQILWRTFRRKP